MTNICDNKSVGMFVWNGDKLLMIERKKFPPGFAVPAGHVDSDGSFEDAAKMELKEEVGLDTTELILIGEGRKENPCRRIGGTWHYWKMYKTEAVGEVHGAPDETKRVGWYTVPEITEMAKRTEEYRQDKVSEEDWAKNPGLEPVMYDWFKELKII